jgi:NADH/NAD ratio-sensing transcriptional regulator Rex
MRMALIGYGKMGKAFTDFNRIDYDYHIRNWFYFEHDSIGIDRIL